MFTIRPAIGTLLMCAAVAWAQTTITKPGETTKTECDDSVDRLDGPHYHVEGR
jgi:hypothetical protein